LNVDQGFFCGVGFFGISGTKWNDATYVKRSWVMGSKWWKHVMVLNPSTRKKVMIWN
jgi:hypothetical protein